ncbi:MAG: outer membrane beta-barrel protein [Verrucomicrobiota bacterium]|nr:outer membrane beta-barrel protein [Verrucomicrobiota bacterium]
MKKLTLSLCALVAFSAAAFAGPSYSGKEMKQVQQAAVECPQWYADREFNVDVFGTYAFTGNAYREDDYLNVDHAWGGGLDVKYFIARYFGFGFEGFVLDANDTNRGFSPTGFTGIDDRQRRAVGSALGTFTFRYPIPCTRFAPYAFFGGGGIFGGGQTSETIVDPTTRRAFVHDVRASNTELMGQFGGGFEVRITPHIGVIQDFSWNVVNGSNNNFGMVRAGLNFAF